MKECARVLVVDDSEVIRAVVTQHLRLKEFAVLTAEDGRSARRVLSKCKPDCMVLDYQLPDTTGLEFIGALRNAHGEIPFPIVMLTSEGNESIAVDAMKQGVSDYLTKSDLSGEQLCSTVRNAIRNNDLAKEIRERQIELEQFAHTAAHDLKSPLSTIESFAKILRDGEAGGDSPMSQEQALDFIVSSAGRMRTLIEDLLEYSRVGRAAKVPVSVDLGSVVDQIVESLSETIRSQNARVEHAGLPTILGDPTSMLQMMQNLITNALKFRGDCDPIVSISARPKGDDFEIRVADNGIGIDAPHRERIFMAFERLHGPSEYEGTGLGLSLCRKLVEQHGGEIWMEAGKECGSVFCLTLRAPGSPAPLQV